MLALAPAHLLNWYVGWSLILAAFVTGALIGLFFHREDFWGGYSSFRRRIVRLGHIALAALGMLNVIYAISPWPAPTTPATAAGACLGLGSVLMPAVCFLTGWRASARRWFFLPVGFLVIAVILILVGGGT